MRFMDRPSTCEVPVRHRTRETMAAWLGRVGYYEALALQLRIRELKKQGLEEDFLLLLEHPPTITLGRNGHWRNLIAPREQLQARGIICYEVDRGGDITFHGPGQLVVYPVLLLEKTERDVRRYMRTLEESVIGLLSFYDIVGRRNEAHTGVWAGNGKIAAMGVHLSRWITTHGIALNINTDLSFFDLIVPCGLRGLGVASMATITGERLDLCSVARQYALEFGRVFSRNINWMEPTEFYENLGQRAQLSVAGGA